MKEQTVTAGFTVVTNAEYEDGELEITGCSLADEQLLALLKGAVR